MKCVRCGCSFTKESPITRGINNVPSHCFQSECVLALKEEMKTMENVYGKLYKEFHDLVIKHNDNQEELLRVKGVFGK